MKKKYFTYILLIVFSLFMFDNKVEAEILSGDNVGYEKTCKELNLKKNWLFDTGNYDVNCIYGYNYKFYNNTKYEIDTCVIAQIAFNVDGLVNGERIIFEDNFGGWEDKKVDEKERIFDESESFDSIKDYTKCPSKIYFSMDKVDLYENGSAIGEGPVIGYTYKNIYRESATKNTKEMKLYNSKIAPDAKDKAAEAAESLKIIKNNLFEEYNCEEILGDDLTDLLQNFVDIIKVLVPILLIVFGILDFGRAIFSFDEGEMKKAQTKFMKRIIMAMAFFLIPTLLGVVLDIAHNIWPSIDDTLCGIEF